MRSVCSLLLVLAAACASSPKSTTGPAPATGSGSGSASGSASGNAAGSASCMCTMDYDPVCGSDGKTYSNKCAAGCAHAAVAYAGPCEANH